MAAEEEIGAAQEALADGRELPVLRARIEPHGRVDGVPGTELVRRGTYMAVGVAATVWGWRPFRATRKAVQEPLEDVVVSAVDNVVNSRLADRVIDNLLESDEMQRIVEYIANSPEVAAAITQQSAGLVTHYTAEAAGRAQEADATAERIVRRVLLRRQRDVATEPEPPDGGEPHARRGRGKAG